MFVEGNVDRLQVWVDEIHAKDGAAAAFKAYVSLLEFHLPKRQRVEGEARVSGPITVTWMPPQN